MLCYSWGITTFRRFLPIYKLILLAPVVQKLNSVMHWINHYPVDMAIGLRTTYPVNIAIQLLNNRGQGPVSQKSPEPFGPEIKYSPQNLKIRRADPS